jgi:hypothetical protein
MFIRHTPESMTFVDAMTLYGVYLAWSKANQDTDLRKTSNHHASRG